MRISPKHSDSPIAMRKKIAPMERPKMTPGMRSCVSIRGAPFRRAAAGASLPRRNSFCSSGCSVPQMPFSPASMMNTRRKPMNSSQLPISLLITSFMPV